MSEKPSKPRPNAVFGKRDTIDIIDQGIPSSNKKEKPGKKRRRGGKYRAQLASYPPSEKDRGNGNSSTKDIVYSTAQVARFARKRELAKGRNKK